MKALLLKDVNNLEYCDIPQPALRPDEILVKVAACGVCGTDLHLFHGEEGAGSSILPLVMGHEFSGTVVAVGYNLYGECDTYSFKDIVAVNAEMGYTMALRRDGKVEAIGNNENGQCEVSLWTDVKFIDAGRKYSVAEMFGFLC